MTNIDKVLTLKEVATLPDTKSLAQIKRYCGDEKYHQKFNLIQNTDFRKSGRIWIVSFSFVKKIRYEEVTKEDMIDLKAFYSTSEFEELTGIDAQVLKKRLAYYQKEKFDIKEGIDYKKSGGSYIATKNCIEKIYGQDVWTKKN